MRRNPMTDEASSPTDQASNPMRTQGFFILSPAGGYSL
jgi:hypothetical protein